MSAQPSKFDEGALADDGQRLVAEICRRLEWRIRPVVSHLTEAEIQQLLQRMSWLQYKFDGVGALDTLPREPKRPEATSG
jgi:hypothetical protein